MAVKRETLGYKMMCMENWRNVLQGKRFSVKLLSNYKTLEYCMPFECLVERQYFENSFTYHTTPVLLFFIGLADAES